MKTVSYTCDISDCAARGTFVILTELQNEITVYSVNERHSCSDPNHVGYLVLGAGSLSDLVSEATSKKEGTRGAPVDKWVIRGQKVIMLDD